MVIAAVWVLQLFFAACRDQVVKAPPSGSGSLRESVLQQVEQSGLLQQLPALMTAAAVELAKQAHERAFRDRASEKLLLYPSVICNHAQQLMMMQPAFKYLYPDPLAYVQQFAGSVPVVMALALAVTRSVSAEVQDHQDSSGRVHFSHTVETEVSRPWVAGLVP